MTRSWRSVLGQIATGAAFAVGAANVVLSLVALVRRVPFLQAVATSDLPVSIEILGVLGLHCVLAHAVGHVVGRVSRTASWPAALPSVALLSLVSAWTALFNIQVLLAPSFTFTVGTVVMTNSYIAVIATYTACAFLSFGFIFLNVTLAQAEGARSGAGQRRGAEAFSVYVSGVHSLFFLVLGVMAGI
jgi:hypothetical protein